MADGMTEGEYRVVLPEFEGPLDLLLHLVKRHELDIFDIPISFITEKYLEYIEVMQALNLDIAGEYLLMAATLAFIKSRELLPRQEEEDEDEEDLGDPRAELVRRLLEYQKYRDVAEGLMDRPLLRRQVWTRGAEEEKPNPDDQPMRQVSSFALVEALAQAMARVKVKHFHDVVVDRISITDRLNELVDTLRAAGAVRFLDCFQTEGPHAQVRHELVVTFMAMLEMARLGMLRILQHSELGEIFLKATEGLQNVDDVEESFE